MITYVGVSVLQELRLIYSTIKTDGHYLHVPEFFLYKVVIDTQNGLYNLVRGDNLLNWFWVWVYSRSVIIQNFYHDTYHDILDKWRYVLWHFVYLCVRHHFFLLRICHIRPWKLILIFEKKNHNIYVAKQILI